MRIKIYIFFGRGLARFFRERIHQFIEMMKKRENYIKKAAGKAERCA